MRSPLAPEIGLVRDTVEPGLPVLRCPKTGGVWLRQAAFHAWREQQPEAAGTEADDAAPGEDVPATDSPAGKRCPEDGYFLIRHRVGNGLDFHLDRCGHCGGVWLDAGEWEALRQRGLATNLHLVFTSAWQAEVRRAQRQALTDQRLTKLLGEADFHQVKQIRRWIDEHAHTYQLRAFLNGDYDDSTTTAVA